MKRYDSYKDSGVEWIGKIPSSWVKTKLKYKLQEVVTGGTPDTSNDSFWSDQDNGINWISISDITSNGREITETKKFISEKGLESKNLKILPIGSLIYSIYGSIGKISRLGIPSTVHQGILGLKTNSTYNSSFLEYYLIYFKEYVSIFSSSNTQENLNQEKVSNFDVPVPPLSEQQQIVSFLDTKTSLIDSLIEKTQRKIELLKEKRTSLINEVVTKGLNPNVEMKDSGIEWIGEIPSHWEVKRVKHLIEDDGGIKIGPFGSSLKLDTLTDDGIKVYGQGNVIKDDFTIGYRHIPFEKFESDFSQYEIFEGDILITMMGTTGKSKVFKKEFKRGILDSHLLRLRFKKESFISDLFVTVLQESDYVFHQLRLNSKGSIMEGLNSSIVKELILMTPPLSEQTEIVSYLDEQTQLIDKTITIEEKRIELLKEYRQSLISEVVTGKRKVV